MNDDLTKRKFARGRSTVGTAAAIRQAVVKDLREISSLNKQKLVKPIDYENYVTKNRTLLHHDSLPDLLLFPHDDILQSELSRRLRTVNSSVPPNAFNEAQQLLARESIKSYTSKWNIIHFKFNAYSNGFQDLPKLGTNVDLSPQKFEIDMESESKEEENALKSHHTTVMKKGWLLKGPDSASESIVGFSRSFKRRFCYLKQQADASYVLEFYKDDKRAELKGSVFLDSAVDVSKGVRKMKLSFEIQTQDKADKAFHFFAAESEQDLEEWITALKKVIQGNDSALLERIRDKDVNAASRGDSIRRSFEQSMNPELQKYARETDNMLAQQRREGRRKIFLMYPEIKKMLPSERKAEDSEHESDLFREQFGTRFLVQCDSFRLRLQANLADDGQPERLDNPEPFFLTFALYDSTRGKKISEDFHFNPNSAEIRQMIPNDVYQPANNGTSPSGGTSSAEFSSFLPDPITLEAQKMAIFSVTKPNPDIFLVVRIEKVLQGSISAALENYLRTTDQKTGTKIHRSMKVCCQRLGRYRMPFVWAARPLFRKYSQDLDTTADFVVYKAECSRMCEEEIIKQLQDLRRTDKQRMQPIQGVVLKVNVSQLKQPYPLCILTPTLLAVRPFDETAKHTPTREVEEFVPEDGPSSNVYTTYVNHLYFHPKNLKFDAYKTSKARNIACNIEIRDSDEDGSLPLRVIYGPLGSPLFVSSSLTTVLHHNTSPDFMDEVKMSLPTHLHDKHHMVFTFYHIACDLTTKPSSKKGLNAETVVGYAWFPLLQHGRVNVGEHTIRVASNLPSGYLSFESLGLGKGSVGPDVRWIDGGRPLFRFGLLLMSTIYTKDPHLHNFFTHCQKLENLPSISTDINSVNKVKSSSGVGASGSGSNSPSVTETGDIAKLLKTKDELLNVVKSLHAVEVSTIINFLPSLLTQLFRLLTRTAHEDVAVNAAKVLIHVVSMVHDAKKTALLNSYVKYVFVTEMVAGQKPKTVHEELAKHLKMTLWPNNADQVVVSKFLKHSWFFFEVLIKSMAQHLLITDRIKMARNERFPSSYQFHVEVFVQSLCQHIVQKYKESVEETKSANASLAQFIKKCLTLMDRGAVFNFINFYMEHFSLHDAKVLSEMKFEFLRIVCNHEHFIPLNLPMMKQMKSYKDVKHDYTLSEEFQKTHFLVGLLLYEVKAALNEIQDIRKCAIKVLRNILVKHALDDRYSSKASQARICALYLPLITIILENKSRLHVKDSVHPSPGYLPNGDTPSVDTPSRTGSLDSYSSQMSLDQTSLSSASSAGSSVSQPRPARDPVFSLISGPVLNTQSLLEQQQRRSHYGSTSSLASTVSAHSTSTIEKLSDGMSQKDGREKCDSMISVPCSSVAGTVVTRYDKLTQEEIKDLLICFLYIVKNLAEEVLLGWFNNSPEYDVIDFLDVLEICMHLFHYPGKQRIKNFSFIGDSSRRSATMPVAMQRIASSNFSALRTSGVYSDPKIEASGVPEADCGQQILLDANLSVETGLIILDIICVYSEKFKEVLHYQDGENPVMRKVFELYMLLIQANQSEAVHKHTFAALRLFVGRFPRVLFEGLSNLCGRLCYEILRCCSSRQDLTRSEACTLLYLMMRKNCEISKTQSFNRVHLQVIISVSQLISNSAIISNSRFAESLSIISSYASSETGLQHSSFSVEVKELTKCVRTVLMATAAMKEHEKNPEMLVDLQYSLAKSYTSNPELRKTWLESMAQIHLKNLDYSEAAHCYIHIAALIAEYLKRRGEFPQGCTVFQTISPNVGSEEVGMRDDSGVQLEVAYCENDLTGHLETSAKHFQNAERYELLGDIYRFIIPIYEQKRDFQKLADAYKLLHEAYSKIIDVVKSSRRLLGKYFRVAFYGQSFFAEEGGKQYIYKEPKITNLTEICERLMTLYSNKYGQGNVKLHMDSNKVNVQELDPKFAYIQVTYVTPYFDEKELAERQTHFERNNNINRFMFETPFTADGKAHGLIDEQQKRRTILTTSHSFPYVKKRIQVIYQKEEVLSPIEVAIDEMKNKVAELNEVVEERDIKKLQLKLQGCVSVQVNAGPLAYAETFLVEGKVHKYKRENVGALKEYFRSFVQVCKEALILNSHLISDDQRDYQESLRKNFDSMAGRLGEIFGEALLEPEDDRCSVASNRGSLILQGSISTAGSILTF